MAMQSFAQVPMDAMRKMFAGSAVSMECSYKTEIRGVEVTANSSLVVQGGMYKMTGNGLEIYCNGNSVWTVDEAASEVVIESCDAQGCDYAANPALMLADIDILFKVTEKEALAAGMESYALEAAVPCGVSRADLIVASDGKIVKGTFVLEDGHVLSVDVVSMKKTEEKPASFFSPGRKFSSDWIVTDLR